MSGECLRGIAVLNDVPQHILGKGALIGFSKGKLNSQTSTNMEAEEKECMGDGLR